MFRINLYYLKSYYWWNKTIFYSLNTFDLSFSFWIYSTKFSYTQTNLCSLFVLHYFLYIYFLSFCLTCRLFSVWWKRIWNTHKEWGGARFLQNSRSMFGKRYSIRRSRISCHRFFAFLQPKTRQILRVEKAKRE